MLLQVLPMEQKKDLLHEVLSSGVSRVIREVVILGNVQDVPTERNLRFGFCVTDKLFRWNKKKANVFRFRRNSMHKTLLRNECMFLFYVTDE